jgi:hypothetical protein
MMPITLALMMVVTLPASAAERPVDVIEVTLRPAAESTPALKHRLWPTPLVQHPGNAATLYDKAFLLLAQQNVENKLWEDIGDWLEKPVADLPRDKVRETLGRFDSVLRQVSMGARRERCDWDLPIREESNVLAILLPEMSSARSVARLVALKAKLQIAEQQYDAAIETLQTGYVLARHVGEQPFLISGLVGLAITSMMNRETLNLSQAPGSPNLYWPLASLPRPLVSLRHAFETEAVTLYLIFPELQPARRATYTPEQWDRVFYEILERFGELSGEMGQADGVSGLKHVAMAAVLTTMAPTLKQDLKRMGHSTEEIDAMSLSQLVLVHAIETFDAHRDSVFKWFNIPQWQARVGLDEAEKELAALRQKQVVPSLGTILASLLLPAIKQAHFAEARLERELAAMRTIEALRLHAARNGGKLPVGLDDVTSAPIPLNPVTGKPFPYRLDDEGAILESDGPKDQARVEYRIRLAKD